jgi:hypothetical protein
VDEFNPLPCAALALRYFLASAWSYSQGLTFVHCSAQPEPLLSLKINTYSPQKSLRLS